MNDLEEQLRATLERKAEEAIPGARNAMPPHIVRRVHRRQARTMALAGVTLAAFVSVSMLATHALVNPEIGGQPLGGAAGPTFTVFDPPIQLGPALFRLASGAVSGESWNLFASKEDRAGRGVELEIQTSSGHTSGTGGFTVPEAKSIETTSAWVGTTATEQVVFGAVVPEAAGLLVESTEGGTTPGVVMSLPKSLGANFKVIVAQLSGDLEGDIVISDAEGREIARAQHIPGPPPFPDPTARPTPPLRPGEPIPQLDHFGNTVGFVPWKRAFGEPSGPPGALEEDFPWVSPGLQVPEVTIEEIRATARVSLTEVWTAVRSWWERRPGPAAPDSAFLDWWTSYPIGTEPIPGVVEITPQG